MATTYPVLCDCGANQEVPATAAGSRVACRCGRTVEVPSLVRLKAAAGQVAISPDLELEHLVLSGALPLELACVVCGRDTPRRVDVAVVCETATVDDGQMPTWQKVLIGLFTPVIIWRYQSRRAAVHGRDVQFRLPVRLCEVCDTETTTRPDKVRAVLEQTPVYARLLSKYPHARIARVG